VCRNAGSTVVIKHLLENKAEVRVEHLRELVNKMLWKITEAEETYNTHCRSCTAIEGGQDLRYEHIFTKKIMIDAPLRCCPDQMDEILKTAVGCTVTKGEHDRLTKFN
jgi:hypothetical protein